VIVKEQIMNQNMIVQRWLFMLVAGLLTLSATVTVRAQATTEHFDASYTIVDTQVGYSCIGGDGEDLLVNGPIHIHGTVTYDANGIGHWSYHENLQGVAAIGLQTGTQYRFVDTRNNNVSDHRTTTLGKELTSTINTRIVRQGSGIALRDHATFHVTYNANGDETAYVDHIVFACQ
jgi:hypothetical protein